MTTRKICLYRPKRVISLATCCLVTILFWGPVHSALGQVVTVGSGSYSTSLPFGAVGPQNAGGQSISPKISPSFSLPIQSNDYWSSLIYPFYSVPHSNVMYAHPLNVKAVGSGLEIGHTSEPVFAASDYLFPFSAQMTVGVQGLSATQTMTQSYGDWTVTARWASGAKSMEATLGHGLPYVFFRLTGGNARIQSAQVPTVWHNQDGVLAMTIAGKHYGVFAPSGSTWSGTGTFESSLNGQDYLSVALLPDASAATLELFKKHAYAFVTNSTVTWNYDEPSAKMTSTFSYETELMENNGTSVNETMTALYRHQWLNTSAPLTTLSYASPNGLMKLLEGSTFTTELQFSGVLPSLPDLGDYNKEVLLGMVKSAATEVLPSGGSYDNGKAIARFANLVHIADQLGAVTERDHFLSEIKRKLEAWFTAGGAEEYSYIDNWDVLTGYPSGFGADNQINDHHFHASYAVMSAATVAAYDRDWAAPENWGGMVNLLIKDANNWDRTDDMFPFLRSHDAYAGHSWAAGHGDFGDGNNQESSSESINFASAAILWGEATAQKDIRDLGIFLHATEASAVDQYWFDVDNEVFPEDYPHVAIGMVWGGKGVHSTWFGADPEFIHGINLLPITAGSLYLGRYPDYVLANYNEVVAERNGQPTVWQDIFWEYLALSDANLALSHYYADEAYVPFDGESRAHTLHWLYNLKKMGHVDTSVFADLPTYAVFRDGNGDKTYVAYNAGTSEKLVSFSDGFSMTVPAGQMETASTRIENLDAPVALLQSSKTEGKAPLTIEFQGNRSFDRNGRDLLFEWSFESLGTSTAMDTTVTFNETGTFWVRLEVTNSLNLTAKDSVLISVLGNGSPFSGTPASVPGRIQAEHFDKGGEGRAYHDAEAHNIGLAFRPDEGVDIEPSNDQGFDVYWITAGEWIEYTFQVAEAGLYTFSPYVASVPGMGGFTLLVDNVDVSGYKPVVGTGGWQFWRPIDVEHVPLEAGIHIMRFEFDSPTDKDGWLFSLNYINVSRSSQTGTDDDDLVPNEYILGQNYPNPFNPSSEIQYVLPISSPVRLEVFNSLGQHVKTLLDTHQQAGVHNITFDGSALSSGMYLYRMTTPAFTQTRKMFLLK